MFHFYSPWKLQKTRGFMAFSEGIEMESCKMGWTTTVSKTSNKSDEILVKISEKKVPS